MARPQDRMRTAIRVAAVVLALLVVPVMAGLGSVVHDNLVVKGEQQTRTWHRVVAVSTEDTLGAGPYQSEPLGSEVWVTARWRDTDETIHTGQAPVDRGTRAGDKVVVWLDEHNSPVVGPIDGEQALVAGVFVAVTGWLSATGLVALVGLAAVRLLDRGCLRAWQEEWERVEPKWRNQFR